jgi:NAD(P)-dependent dehydrogenase (short-subunit alcohol dehydrogenase family)
MVKQTWLITGCSSGFGEQLVRQLTAQGDQVIATGRNVETRLEHLKDTGATILDLDVTAPQAEIDRKFQQALNAYGSIDVIVNNAGFIQCGALEELRYVLSSRVLQSLIQVVTQSPSQSRRPTAFDQHSLAWPPEPHTLRPPILS